MGSLMINLLRNHRWVRRWKYFENRSTLPKLWAIKYRVDFMKHSVIWQKILLTGRFAHTRQNPLCHVLEC